MPVLLSSAVLRSQSHPHFMNDMPCFPSSQSSRSDEDPADAEEFSNIRNGYPLDGYRRLLVFLYTNPPTNSEEQQPDLERWKVSEIRIFKDRQSPFEHEYLVATVCDGDGRTIFLRIERMIQKASESQIATEDRQGKVKKLAADEISVCPSKDLNSEQVLVHRFAFTDSGSVTLPKLVVLACMINKHCTTYNIAWRNCYWFCYVASEVLKMRFPHTQLLVEEGGQQGCWHCIPTPVCVRMQTDGTIKYLLKSYDEKWTEFIQEVEHRINHPGNKHTVEAKQEAEMQKDRADRESRRADQEARRADDLKRELESLRRMLGAQ